jgi:hypothetical protein
MLMAFSIPSNAQTKFTNRNNDERLAERIFTTTDVLTKMDSVKISDNEIGILQVTMIGYAKDSASGVTGIKQCRYNKVDGVLTMGTVTDLLTTTTDAELSGATFGLLNSNNKIYVTVTGLNGVTITWTCLVKRKSVSTVL